MQIQIDGRNIEDISDVLFPILNGREDKAQKLTDFNHAISVLRQAMAEKGLTDEWKDFINSLEKAAKSSISYDAYPLLSELAYRTAFKLNDINHSGNNERYCDLLKKIETRAKDNTSVGLRFKHTCNTMQAVAGFFITIYGLMMVFNPFTFVLGILVMSAGAGICGSGFHDPAGNQIIIGQKYHRTYACLSTVNKTLSSLAEANAVHVYPDGGRVIMSETRDTPSTDDELEAPTPPRTKIQINNKDIASIDDLLFTILNGREHEAEKSDDLQDAIDVLEKIIQENDQTDNAAFKTLVKELKEVRLSNLSPHEFPLFSELAYRTALQIQNHTHTPSRFEVLLTKIEERAKKLDDYYLLPQSVIFRKVLNAAFIALGALYVIAGGALISHGFFPGIAVVAAGVLLIRNGYNSIKQLTTQSETKEKYVKINESMLGCVSTLFAPRSRVPTPEGQPSQRITVGACG